MWCRGRREQGDGSSPERRQENRRSGRLAGRSAKPVGRMCEGQAGEQCTAAMVTTVLAAVGSGRVSMEGKWEAAKLVR